MRELRDSDTTKDLSSSERSFGIEKGRRADINSARYYEKNFVSIACCYGYSIGKNREETMLIV